MSRQNVESFRRAVDAFNVAEYRDHKVIRLDDYFKVDEALGACGLSG
jgi:hypothetical protein